MRPFLAALLLLLTPLGSLWSRTYHEVPELDAIFDRYGVTGIFVLLDSTRDRVEVSNKLRAQQRFAPASTFKIANSLIGLDAGAVKNVDEVLPYGGKPQRFKAWERDMNLRDAIKASNVAVYQELARRIGLKRMRAGVKKLNYGNQETGGVVDRFWLDGPLAISAQEQMEFLQRLVAGRLPVKQEAVRAIREITLLEKTVTYELHGKTGWLFNSKRQIGWWVGWVEREGMSYPFALNIDMFKDEDAEKRVPIGRECLKVLGKL
jgi:beta-lactamase class D OXA-50